MNLKNFLKKVMNFFCFFMISPLLLSYYIFCIFGDKDKLFGSYSQFISLIPGLIGSYIRKKFLQLTIKKCSNDCAIMFGTIFSKTDTEIGKKVYIGAFNNIGSSIIEDYCTLGSNVHILSGKRQHFFNDLKTPIQEQGGELKKIVIGEDTWIGNGALIMANIGKKCIIGAGSVLTRDVQEYSIVAGNPAKIIGKR